MSLSELGVGVDRGVSRAMSAGRQWTQGLRATGVKFQCRLLKTGIMSASPLYAQHRAQCGHTSSHRLLLNK